MRRVTSPSAVRLALAPPLLTCLAAPIGNCSGADLEVAGNLDPTAVAPLIADENAFTYSAE